MNPDGTNQTNITNNAAADTEPNYSPDGSKIIFTTNRDGNNEIYRMNADGSRSRAFDEQLGFRHFAVLFARWRIDRFCQQPRRQQRDL